VAVNCAGVTETLLESELFGHVRGSFTGAYRDQVGQLQLAHRGTLFLDEVGEMSLRMQALLLRFLESGEIRPVGAEQPHSAVDVRVIAATNRDIDARVAAGDLRADLIYRLRVVHLAVPPLRERREDIPVLIERFIAQSGRRVNVSAAAMRMLLTHRWSGNVRELRNVVEQIMALLPSDVIEVEHLPASVRTQQGIRLVVEGERRRQVADELYDALVRDGYSFFEHIHPLFLSRDITRHDVRELVRRGLTTTRGNYRALLNLFGLREEEYKKFLNFLGTHDCSVDFRPFRTGDAGSTKASRKPRVLLTGLPSPGNPHEVS
jgi:DNA-binding NtrC family response regulator